MSDSPLPNAAGITPAPSPVNAGAQAIKEAVDLLRAALPKLQETNPVFADGLSSLLRGADDPVRSNQAEFQHRIAYAVKDVENIAGHLPFSSANVADRLDALASSAPGLKNDRVETLLSDANQARDMSLRRDARRMAMEIGKQADQDTPQIRSQLDALENRVRILGNAPKEQSAAPPLAQPAAAAASPGLDDAGQPAGAAGTARTQASAAGRQTASLEPALAPASAAAVIANGLLRGFTKLGEAIPPPPWEPMTTNFGDGLKRWEQRHQAKADQAVIDGLEQSGKAALSALQNFAGNEGATMMNRINQAARSDPDGIAGVMAEMREGGRYASLRQQFNVAITDEKSFAAAYDKALDAVGAYAQERTGAKPIVARSADPVAVTARLEALEQNIGERMAGTPSRSDGKSMMDDLHRQAAEIFKAVAESLKNLFQRVSSGASAGPSP